MKNLVLFISIVVITFSCDKENNNISTVINSSFGLKVKTLEGIDLLNPSNDNSYKIDDLEIKYLKDGIEKSYFENHLDYPKGLNLIQRDDEYILTIYVDSSENNEFLDFKLYWNDKESETIRVKFYISDNIKRIDEIWINDNLEWSFDDKKIEIISLIK